MESTIFDESPSEVQQFYAGRCIFVTGVTGFLGKILVEKLLRCCPDIRTIYLLMRPKKGKSPKERLEILLEKECFDPLKAKHPDFRQKIVVIVGDVVEPRCGICDDDLEVLQREVSIVLHSAARVQFLDPLRTVVRFNVIGTRNVLEVSKGFLRLEAFVHVSTAFSRREPDCTVPEEVGGCHATPNQVLGMLEFMDDEPLQKITSSIVKEKITTYQFSKALAELVVEDEKGNIPAAIVRPCLVCSSWKEPLTGWCDIFQGITGLFVAAAKGFLRTVYAPPNYRVLAIPVDVVANCIIATAWYTATMRPEGTFVVNCAMKYEDFPVGQGLVKPILRLRSECPLMSIYRYPEFTVYKYNFLYKIHALIDHFIPAVVIDTLLFIFTGKTLMIRLYRKIHILWNIFLEQGSFPWYFCLENFNRVRHALSAKDAEVFFMNLEEIKWLDYIEDCMRGGRKFLVHENPSNIPRALLKSRIWWLVTTVLKWCLIFFFIYHFLIPQSLKDTASMYFSSYLYASEPPFGIPSSEITYSESLNKYRKI